MAEDRLREENGIVRHDNVPRQQSNRDPDYPTRAEGPPYPTPESAIKWVGSNAELEARALRRKRWRTAAALLIAGFLLASAGVSLDRHDPSPWIMVPAIVILYVAAIVWVEGSARYGRDRRKFAYQQEALHEANLARAVARLEDQLSLANLFGLNRTVMDEYHRITKQQAERSFRNSQVAMGLGFLALIGGACVALAPTQVETKIAVAGLSAVGSLMAGFISKTFLRSHQISIKQLNTFFREPLVNSYLLTAERLSQQLNGGAREDAQVQIITQAIASARRAEAGETSTPDDGSGETTRKRRSSRRRPATTAKGGPAGPRSQLATQPNTESAGSAN
ncbi:hypothetical protein [Actinoplanes sp. NPDC049681]|uniref:TRADD-N-associated membrane domain-containing protein n=1 Tax=Actinoplanes sp. NPDC049681 TaxID=3363905 RepID=UPI003798D9DA